MARDFFDGLSETIGRTAREFSGKAENFYEISKIRNKMRTEERLKEKELFRLGMLIYERYCEGEALDEEIEDICAEVEKHEKAAILFGEEVSKAKGEKACPVCGKNITENASFCQYCGADCRKEPTVNDVQDENDMKQASEDVFEVEDTVEE